MTKDEAIQRLDEALKMLQEYTATLDLMGSQDDHMATIVGKIAAVRHYYFGENDER